MMTTERDANSELTDEKRAEWTAFLEQRKEIVASIVETAFKPMDTAHQVEQMSGARGNDDDD